jgi:serine palmitoyltransferase
LYYRIRDCWNRPIDSRPSRVIGLMERVSDDYNYTFRFTGRIVPCINMASYNYLGFAADTPYVTQKVLDSIDRFGVGTCSAPFEAGYHELLQELETRTAEFVGKEAAMACGMGFATNFGGLPGMFCKDTLVISDSLNHASIVGGLRQGPAKVKVFPHNNYERLESMIRSSIIEGQPRLNRPWKRIVIVTEGIYSMEGEIGDLKKLVELKRKYKVLLYVDEAHSIGALGKTGRGVCEYCGVDPKDVDVLMGTYTKSFGSIGGYIAADKPFIDYLKTVSSINLHADAMAAGAVQQALAALEVILGEDGTDLGQQRIKQLADNSRFLRQGLRNLGVTVYGQDESPVIPMMLYSPSKIPIFSRECLKRGVAVVVVGYPATGVLESRCRFCVSAGHTREDLEQVLRVVDEVASITMVRYESDRIHWFA